MAVGDTYVFPGFLTPVLTQLFFPKPPTTFLTCFCRGERRKYAGKKSGFNRGSNSQPPGHESDTHTTEPPGWGLKTLREKEKMLITCSTTYKDDQYSFYLVKMKCFNPITRRQNIRLFQIEANCRQHFKVHLIWKNSAIWGRKQMWEKEKLLVTMFSKAICL